MGCKLDKVDREETRSKEDNTGPLCAKLDICVSPVSSLIAKSSLVSLVSCPKLAGIDPANKTSTIDSSVVNM